MSLDLVRIDDRLVHGQVVIGWGTYLNTNRIILCSDPIADSKLESDMYMSAKETVLYPLTISVYTQKQTIQELCNNTENSEKIILLVETPKELLQLINSGLKIDKINVGGMHYSDGKRQLTPYIYVDDDDIFSFKQISKMGIKLEGKDVPSGKSIDISKIVNMNYH